MLHLILMSEINGSLKFEVSSDCRSVALIYI